MMACYTSVRRIANKFHIANYWIFANYSTAYPGTEHNLSYYYSYIFLEVIYYMLLYRYERAGNEQFVTETSKWVFHERGHLKVILPYFSVVILFRGLMFFK